MRIGRALQTSAHGGVQTLTPRCSAPNAWASVPVASESDVSMQACVGGDP